VTFFGLVVFFSSFGPLLSDTIPYYRNYQLFELHPLPTLSFLTMFTLIRCRAECTTIQVLMANVVNGVPTLSVRLTGFERIFSGSNCSMYLGDLSMSVQCLLHLLLRLLWSSLRTCRSTKQ